MIRKLAFLPVLLLLVSSCSSYKKVPYLQTKQTEFSTQTDYANGVVRFQVDDVLSITVNAIGEPVIAADFNLPLQPSATSEDMDENYINQGQGRQTYRVNSLGEIQFPVLGPIRVAGLTEEALEVKLKDALGKYMKTEPVITIRLMNYKISVLGEVNRPGQYNISKNRVNVMEALTLAGDMSIYGKRDNVKLMRTSPDGTTQIIKLDLTQVDLVKSPYFYLQQNDILYIEPNKARAKSSDIGSQTGILISLGSILLSAASLIVTIAK